MVTRRSFDLDVPASMPSALHLRQVLQRLTMTARQQLDVGVDRLRVSEAGGFGLFRLAVTGFNRFGLWGKTGFRRGGRILARWRFWSLARLPRPVGCSSAWFLLEAGFFFGANSDSLRVWWSGRNKVRRFFAQSGYPSFRNQTPQIRELVRLAVHRFWLIQEVLDLVDGRGGLGLCPRTLRKRLFHPRLVAGRSVYFDSLNKLLRRIGGSALWRNAFTLWSVISASGFRGPASDVVDLGDGRKHGMGLCAVARRLVVETCHWTCSGPGIKVSISG